MSNQQMIESCGVQSINGWVERRKRKCDEHVTRMDAERLAKISRDYIPAGRKSPGRPKGKTYQVYTFQMRNKENTLNSVE